MILLPGLGAFGLFLLFDYNKIYWRKAWMNLLFPLGGVLLAVSTALCILEGRHLRLWALILAVIAAAGLIYALFFALPKGTYTEQGSLPVVAEGLYGLCRHPAFWPMAALYWLLWLAFGGPRLLAAAVIYPLCNFFYILLQDRRIFPQYIRGYDDYKRQVPFLIPTPRPRKKETGQGTHQRYQGKR